MRIQPAVLPHHPFSLVLRVLALAACVALAAGCSSDDDAGSSGVADEDSNPPRILGRVLSTSDQLMAGSGEGMFAAILRLLAGHAQAASPGLNPVPGVQVELLRVDDSGAVSRSPVETVVTDADGAFVIDGVPARGRMLLRASLRTEVIRAFVTGETIELTPASELAVRRVENSIQEGESLSSYSRVELAALSGYLEGLRVDATGSFDETITLLEARAGGQFDALLEALVDNEELAINDGDHGVVEFTSSLRDPSLATAEGFSRGIDVASGAGMLTLDSRARAERAFVPRAVFVRDIFSDNPVRTNGTAGTEDLIPGNDLRGLAHAIGSNGQVLSLDTTRPPVAVVPGAVTADATLMVNPLLITIDGPDGIAAAGGGLRFVSRWSEPARATETLTRLDPLGAEATQYHLVRMFHSYAVNAEADVTIGAGSGIMSFDSVPQSREFIGDPEPGDYGSFLSGAGLGAMTLGSDSAALRDSRFAAIIPSSGLFRVVRGTGMMELRADDDGGSRIGGGVVSADGRVVVMEMAAADENRQERALAIAIRRSENVPPVAGRYHLVEYTNRIIVDPELGDRALGISVRHGALHLNAEDGLIDEADLFTRTFSLGIAETASIEAEAVDETMVLPGTWSVDESGAVRLELAVERSDGSQQRIEAAGAADASGNFIALAIRNEGSDGGEGRGLLLLVRQSGE